MSDDLKMYPSRDDENSRVVMTNMQNGTGEDLTAVVYGLVTTDLECGNYELAQLQLVGNRKDRSKSNVWKFFTRGEKDTQKAKCNICDKYLDFRSQSTSNLIKHLKKVHKKDPGCMPRRTAVAQRPDEASNTSQPAVQQTEKVQTSFLSNEGSCIVSKVKQQLEGTLRKFAESETVAAATTDDESAARRRIVDRLDAICKCIDVRTKCGDRTTKDHLPQDIQDLLYPVINL